MTEAVDEDSAHRYFAAEFFNSTWNMLSSISDPDERHALTSDLDEIVSSC